MDQSVYVRQSIESLIEEGVLGAVLCSLVILLFLGEWRMTVIAVLTIPIAVLAALIGLYATGNTINVMTLAGLSLAIGPLVDSAIICLENTHRHLGLGATPQEAAFLGASEVAMPELVASLCTLLVLAPLALMPGLGEFLFRPMALAVAFAMIVGLPPVADVRPGPCAALAAGRTARSRTVTHGTDYEHRSEHETAAAAGLLGRAVRPLGGADRRRHRRVRPAARPWCMRRRLAGRRWAPSALLVAVVVVLGLAAAPRVLPRGRRRRLRDLRPRAERHPDRGDREADRRRSRSSSARRSATDLELIITELGVVADWSAAYTPNAGPMDAVVKVQLTARPAPLGPGIRPPAPRRASPSDPSFGDLEFAFDAGGMIRGGHERGQVHADQRPDHRQEPGEGAPGGRRHPGGGPGDERGGRCNLVVEPLFFS